MKYTINPCNACQKKFRNKECNINDLNNCYAETLAAYERYPNNFIILDGQAKNNWKECMLNKMATLPYVAGKPRDFCNFQLQPAPVFVGDHFFQSKLYENNGDSIKALNECNIECKKVKNKIECQINCQVDFDALESVEKDQIEYVENYEQPNVCDPSLADEKKDSCGTNVESECINKGCCYEPTARKLSSGDNVPWCYKNSTSPPSPKHDKTNFNDIACDKPATFYTLFIITSILLGFILFVFFVVLLSKNIGTN